MSIEDVTFHDPTNPLDWAVAARDAQVMDMVRQAVRSGNVVLAYQEVRRSDAPDKVAFHEGLARVIDPTGRVIPAAQFIDRVERDALGREIDCIALRQGLDALATHNGLRLAINMSARSIGYAPWMDTLRRGLQAAPGVGDRLILEITERSAIVMPDVVSAFMKTLRSQGISFALDDFGAGYTSFRYLRDLLFDCVKIEGQFIRGISTNVDNQMLTTALITLAQHFDMMTVAEGVEDQADADFLRTLGVDCLQGYLYDAPRLRPDWGRQAIPLRA